MTRALRIGGVPAVYAAATWEGVRDSDVREWCRTLPVRVLPTRHDPNPNLSARPNWALAGVGLLIAGPVGTGKSSAAALCCREAAALAVPPVWYHTGTLLDALAGGTSRERRDLTDRLGRAGLLVLDDFGAREMADWEVGHLDTIVEARYNSRRPMVVTTNWTPDDLKTDERLARITDRWRQRTAQKLVVLSGASRRG